MRFVKFGALGLVFAIFAISCTGNTLPAPNLATKYDAVIAFCDRRLADTQDVCDQIGSTTDPVVYIHVLLGNAGGHELVVETEIVEGGSYAYTSPPDRIPEDRSRLHTLEVFRDPWCAELPCQLEARVFVDDELVLIDQFAFIED